MRENLLCFSWSIGRDDRRGREERMTKSKRWVTAKDRAGRKFIELGAQLCSCLFIGRPAIIIKRKYYVLLLLGPAIRHRLTIDRHKNYPLNYMGFALR